MSKSQCKEIAAFLAKPGARLTSLDALRLWGCSRLAARVLNLKESGMEIDSRMVQVIGSNGVSRVAEYSLAVKV
jgi:hypothetical protein